MEVIFLNAEQVTRDLLAEQLLARAQKASCDPTFADFAKASEAIEKGFMIGTLTKIGRDRYKKVLWSRLMN